MKRLVLLGEGHGEVSALPSLIKKLLAETLHPAPLLVDELVIRRSPTKLITWDKSRGQPNYDKWLDTVTLALRRGNVGGVLAVYDGDLPHFPAGSGQPFCAAKVATQMAEAATRAGAGKTFSLAVVIARKEYETWLIAGVESLAGRRLADGRLVIPEGVKPPGGDTESHGKRWLRTHYPGYNPALDQRPLTELLDLRCVQEKRLRSFSRLEHALAQLLDALAGGVHVSTPC